MALTLTLSNHFKYQLGIGAIDLRSTGDTIKAALMNTSFAFDKDAHATLADVTASQLATGGGYTQNDKTLSVDTNWSEDDTNDKGTVVYSDFSWVATSGGFGPVGSLLVYDDTTSDDTVIGCIDFGTDYTIPEGLTLSVNSLTVDLS